MKKFLGSLLTIAFLLAAGQLHAAAEWTLMFYLDGDNQTEAAAINTFLDLAEVGSSSKINVIAQLDRIPDVDGRYDDWTDANRFKIEPEMEPLLDNAKTWSDGEKGREVGMDDYESLLSFIKWSKSEYPAKKYCLVIWSHTEPGKDSEPYRSICVDDTSGGKSLTTKRLALAIDEANTDLELIVFDAPLAQMLETAYELRDQKVYAMAGNQQGDADNTWPWPAILQNLVDNPEWNGISLGEAVADAYHEKYPANTISVIDPAATETLGNSLDTLANAMIEDWDAADRQTIVTAAESVRDEMKEVILYNQCDGSIYPGANGLSINFPTTGRQKNYSDGNLDFVRKTPWGKLLAEFNDKMRGSWLNVARNSTQVFDYDYADIADICAKLINYVDPRQYTETEGEKEFIGKGQAMDWKQNDRVWSYDLPFSFMFYGTYYDTILVCSNGYLDFANDSSQSDNSVGSLIKNIRIAPLWDDLDTSDGNIYIHQPGDDSICFRWKAKVFVTATKMKPVNVEATLYASGDIRFAYGSGNTDIEPTVGLSAGDGEKYDVSCIYNDETKLGNKPALWYYAPTPKIVTAIADREDQYLDVYFNSGVWSDEANTSPVATSDLKLDFNINGGFASAAAISGLTDTDGAALTGGESVIRVWLTITGEPCGLETIEIKPADRHSFYNTQGFPANENTTTGKINIGGLEVATGSIFTIIADEVPGLGGVFRSKPKIYGEYLVPDKEPGTVKTIKTSFKTLTKVSKPGAETVDAEVQKSIVLLAKNSLKDAYKQGVGAAEFLADPVAPKNIDLYATVGKSGGKVDKNLSFSAPLATGALNPYATAQSLTSAHPGGLVVIDGLFFGTKAPKVWLEYDGKPKNGVTPVMAKNCKALKPYCYDLDSGNGKIKEDASCMEQRTGASKITVQLPNLPKNWVYEANSEPVRHDLVIDNGAAVTYAAFHTTPPSTNTAPTCLETIAVEVPENSKLKDNVIDVTALSELFDADGDPVTLSITQDALTGKAKIYKKSAIAYQPEKDFTGIDWIIVNFDDGFGGETSVRVNIDVKPGFSRL